MTYDRLVVEADGGSRGNPGIAGYGALVRDPATGAVLAERAEPLGKVSNNVAEYRGLIAGLEAAALIDADAPLLVRMDSKLVIEQMAGRWKIKHEDMKKLALQARSLLNERGGPVQWEWIPRAQNKAADKLSNDGMDGKTVIRDRWRDAVTSLDDSEAPTTEGPAGPMRVLLVRACASGRQDPMVASAIRSFVRPPVRVLTASAAAAIRTGEAIAAQLDPATTASCDPSVDDGSLERLLAAPAARETLVAVADREPIIGMLSTLLGLDVTHGARIGLAPGSLTGIQFDENGVGTIAFLNDTHHLRSGDGGAA